MVAFRQVLEIASQLFSLCLTDMIISLRHFKAVSVDLYINVYKYLPFPNR